MRLTWQPIGLQNRVSSIFLAHLDLMLAGIEDLDGLGDGSKRICQYPERRLRY